MSFSAGGAETLAVNLSKKYVAAGHRCHIVAIASAASVGNPSEFEATLKHSAVSAEISVETLPAGVRKHFWKGRKALRKAIRRFHPDVIHVHTAYGLLFQMFGKPKAPVIYTHHNVKLNFPRILFPFFNRFVSAYVAICEPCRSLLKRSARRQIVSIPNGVPDPGLGRVRPLNDEPTMLSVGTITAQKDYPNLIRAARKVVDQIPKASFLIAGGGDQSKLLPLISELGLEDRIFLLGARADIPELMQASDVLVNSSRYEGLPLALIEAAMQGLPVVATDVGGNSELVQGNGLLVPPGDPDKLAAAILEVIRDTEGYLARTEAARRIGQRYSLEACTEAHLRLYESVT